MAAYPSRVNGAAVACQSMGNRYNRSRWMLATSVGFEKTDNLLQHLEACRHPKVDWQSEFLTGIP